MTITRKRNRKPIFISIEYHALLEKIASGERRTMRAVLEGLIQRRASEYASVKSFLR